VPVESLIVRAVICDTRCKFRYSSRSVRIRLLFKKKPNIQKCNTTNCSKCRLNSCALTC